MGSSRGDECERSFTSQDVTTTPVALIYSARSVSSTPHTSSEKGMFSPPRDGHFEAPPDASLCSWLSLSMPGFTLHQSSREK